VAVARAIEWLTDIFSEHVFELFGLETTLNNQLVITTNGTSGTQLGQDESQDVIGFTIDTTKHN
jgi:hypothetical protein